MGAAKSGKGNYARGEFVETDQAVSTCPVPFLKNISLFALPKSTAYLRSSRPAEGRFAIVTNVGQGMRWTRQRAGRAMQPADGEVVWS